MQKPRVLVLMATRNGEPWLRQQLDSLTRQHSVAVRVAICDDDSTDATLQVINASRADGLAIELVHSARRGGSAARNFFRVMLDAPLRDCDYVALSDQDDVCHADRFRRAIEHLRREAADGYSSATEAFWPDGRRRLLKQSRRTRPADFLFEGAGQGCSFVLRRDSFETLRSLLARHENRLPHIHYHDWALYALARLRGMRWCFDPLPTLEYRQHALNDTGAKSTRAGLGRRLQLIRSGWYAAQVEAITALCRAVAGSTANEVLDAWTRLHGNSSGIAGRFRRARWLLLNSRRKLGDRLVVATAGLLGYL